MTSEIAERHLKSKISYIPIFVPLKKAKVENGMVQYNNVCGLEDLDYVLDLITLNRTEREKQIVCFMDGLDELGDVIAFYDSIKEYHKTSKFPKHEIYNHYKT
jgi:hypothetical protein